MNRVYALLQLSIISVCLLAAAGANAQGIDPSKIEVRRFERQYEDLIVHLDLDLSDLELKSRGRLELTPYLKTADNSLQLSSLELDGKIRHKVYKRQSHFKRKFDGADKGTVVRYAPKEQASKVHYRDTVPYENWMDTATLYVEQLGCPGCGLVKVELPEIFLKARPALLPTPPGFTYAPNPLVSFLMPETESKVRSQKESAYLKFATGESGINPMFRDNGSELAKVNKLIESLIYDEYVSVQKVTIQGMSSIEGSYDANMRLSERRAKSFEEYLRNKYGLPVTLFSTSWVGEDWTKLRRLVEEGDMMYKSRVLDIINSQDVFSGREKQLMLLHEGGPYKYMLDNYFPLLRRVDYTIEYSVKHLNEDESSKLLKEHPSHLSPKELFMLAKNHDKLSPEFKEIMDLSVATYPENVAVNVNVAASYILRGRYDIAEHYLMSAGNSASSFNNSGVILMMRGRTKEAKEVLSKAKELGSIEAEHNLDELMKLEQSASEQ